LQRPHLACIESRYRLVPYQEVVNAARPFSRFKGNNFSGKDHFQPQGLSGFGTVSGDKYQATGVTQDQFGGSFQNGQAEQSFINNFRIIGQGPGNNFLVHESFHLTFNANGNVTAVHDNFSIDCK
jgi:hypothetical protein